MSEKLKITRGSGNVFRDIGFDKDEAENLKLRSELMIRIESFYAPRA
jgi:predicted XRE-type DNA-binding protein